MNVWNILSLLISALANFEPEEKKNAKLRFRGSSNQRILDVPKSVREKKAVLFEF